MKNCNVIIIVLIGSLATADSQAGQHLDHAHETQHEVTTSQIVSYARNGSITGSFCR